jgi:hypothetical protein
MTPPAEQAVIVAQFDAAEALGAQYASLLEAAKNYRLSADAIATAVQEAAVAESETELDQTLFAASNGLSTSFGVYDRDHDYDLARAQALLENARRYAVVARRSIEEQYVVDLSIMTDDEPFVAAPAGWADSIYEYDLNVLSAVGLTAAQGNTASTDPSVLTDYVANLQAFVQGFAVKRPTAVAHTDTDLVSIPGPSGDPIPPPTASQPGAGSGAWSFNCNGQWKGVTVLPASSVCGDGQPPTVARLQFSLDSWGRLNTTVAATPYVSRFNARWNRIAVNLVGTGLLDCTKATDPNSCYADSYSVFDLRHFGPSWVSDYEQQWHLFQPAVATLEGAKALTAEQWLDPVGNGWDKPYVSAVARSELRERPLDGTYVLDLHLAPETDIDQLERVQLLLETSYWVAEQ